MDNTVMCPVRKDLLQEITESYTNASSPATTGKENLSANVSGKKSSGKKRGPKPKTDEEKERAKKRAKDIKKDAAPKHDKSEYMASKGFQTLDDYKALIEGKANEKGEEYWKDHFKR